MKNLTNENQNKVAHTVLSKEDFQSIIRQLSAKCLICSCENNFNSGGLFNAKKRNRHCTRA